MKKIREKIQKFRVSEKGFTLIELIVVIAIIGILAAIGTVAYSGYIESANQAADEQLAYDVSYAIKLGAMDEGITGINTEDEDAEDNGYVELTSTGMNLYLYIDGGYQLITVSYSSTGAPSYYAQTLAVDYDSLESDAWGELVDGWLTDGVGSNWKSQVLKSDKYTKNEDSDPVKVYIPSGDIYYPNSDSEEKTLSETIAANLTTYSTSSYAGSEEELMEAVEGVATAFGTVLNTFATAYGSYETALATLLGYVAMDDDGNYYIEDEEAWDALLAEYGITDGSTLDAESTGNFMVLYMASQLTDAYTDEDGNIDAEAIDSLVDDIFNTTTYSLAGTLYESATYEDLTAMFGVATAYYLYCKESDDYTGSYDTDYESYLSSMTSATNYITAYSSLYSIINNMVNEIRDDQDGAYGENGAGYSYYESESLTEDATAFMSLMSVLTESYSSGDFSVDVSTMSWDSDAYSYLISLFETYGIDLS